MQYVQHQDQINKIHDVETTKKTLKALGNLKKKKKNPLIQTVLEDQTKQKTLVQIKFKLLLVW